MKNSNGLFGVCSAVMGGAALGFAALPGYVVSGTVLGSTSTTNYSLYNLIFGCDVTPDEKMVAGLLIAFILLVAGVVIDLLIVALSVEGKKKSKLPVILALAGGACLIAGGVMFFFTKNLANLSLDSGSIGGFASASEKMGVAPYLCGALACIGGLADVPVILAK